MNYIMCKTYNIYNILQYIEVNICYVMFMDVLL